MNGVMGGMYSPTPSLLEKAAVHNPGVGLGDGVAGLNCGMDRTTLRGGLAVGKGAWSRLAVVTAGCWKGYEIQILDTMLTPLFTKKLLLHSGGYLLFLILI